MSDVVVKFGDQRVFAHKPILAQRSAYFYTAFTGLFSVRLP
jgi:hypothetical protein